MEVFEWTIPELRALEFLKKNGAREMMRPDWICHHPTKGFWFIVEVKEQERFRPRVADGSYKALGPAGGHGISIYQFIAREKLRKDTNIRTLLVVKEIETGRWFAGYLDELSKGPTFRTGKKIIFALKSFREFVGVPEVRRNMRSCEMCGSTIAG